MQPLSLNSELVLDFGVLYERYIFIIEFGYNKIIIIIIIIIIISVVCFTTLSVSVL
jgi:hypothetical protein